MFLCVLANRYKSIIVIRNIALSGLRHAKGVISLALQTCMTYLYEGEREKPVI